MARGRKNYTLEEKLQIVIKDIENTELCLEKLKEEKGNLELQLKQQRLEEIDKLISESGKSLEEIKELLAS